MLKLNASSLALGAALAVGAMLVMGQAGPQPQYVSWGPPKAGVVCVFRDSTAVNVPPNGYTAVYQVPTDRWVTITDAALQPSLLDTARWAEEYGGVLTEKGYASALAFHSSTGWAFRPGSQIVILNPSPSAFYFGYLQLTGYQTRD